MTHRLEISNFLSEEKRKSKFGPEWQKDNPTTEQTTLGKDLADKSDHLSAHLSSVQTLTQKTRLNTNIKYLTQHKHLQDTDILEKEKFGFKFIINFSIST